MKSWLNRKMRGILNGLTSSKSQDLELNKLPSLGLFYPEGFWLKIKKASLEDIDNYESHFNNNILSVINKVRTIIDHNIEVPEGHDVNSLMSIDVMYIFFEIVKYTLDKKILININGIEIDFTENFHYFQIPEEYISNYNKTDKIFNISGYKYSLPTIGIEKSITDFLISKQHEGIGKAYDKLSYNFMYFLGDKYELTFGEIDNLITIFNEDLETDEMDVVENIVTEFSGFLRYRVVHRNMIFPVDSNIDLEKIWNIKKDKDKKKVDKDSN